MQGFFRVESLLAMPAPNPIKTCPGCKDPVVRARLTFEQQCSPCRKKERNRIWREANPGAMAETAKRWRQAGNKTVRPEGYAEAHRERERERYQTDPEVQMRAKEAAKRQRERLGREVLNAQNREWHHKNPKKAREYHVRHFASMTLEERQQEGRELRERYRVQRQAGSAAYYARRYDNGDVIPNEHLYALHKWQDHCCFYCREPLRGADTIEHIVPLSRGGSNTPWNVVLVCSRCNTRKNNKIFHVEWVPELVADTPRHHSVFEMQRLRKLLTDLGIAFKTCEDYTLIGQRPVFIMSSFWLGWTGDAVLRGIKAHHPDAIIFFDKEFARRTEAVINVLKAKAGISERRGARNLIVDVPESKVAQDFMNRWHAMGAIGGQHYLGLRDANEWWIVAAFRREADRYEVSRMAIRETVAGGVSRIMRHFRDIAPENLPITAFTDQRMGDGKSHLFANFDADGTTERSFFYATPEILGFHPRRDFQKQVLAMKADYYDETRTQVDLAKANGLMRVEGLPRLRFTTLAPTSPHLQTLKQS
jgi:5-methylcytosine-specific restriction endonuclease McrA